MPRVKQAGGKNLTICGECDREISVTKDHFLISQGMESRGRERQWRAVLHNRGDDMNVRCMGSRVVVQAVAVYPREESA